MGIQLVDGAGVGSAQDARRVRIAGGLLRDLRERIARSGDLRGEVRDTLARAASLRHGLVELGAASHAADVEAELVRGIAGAYGEAGIEVLAEQGLAPA